MHLSCRNGKYTSLPLESLDIVHTESGYVNTVVFHYWLTEIFLPFLREQRREKSYYGKVVLILDGFTGHSNAIENLELEQENLEINYLVSHTSDILQPLDVRIFAVMEHFLSNWKTPADYSPQSKKILKCINHYSKHVAHPTSSQRSEKLD